MFYVFNQNNSGGRHHYDDDKGISTYVIVEADDAKEANYRAERIGLYFDGQGDCSCCGNRWYEQYSDKEGTSKPILYDTPLKPLTKDKKPTVYVHYKKGRYKDKFKGYLQTIIPGSFTADYRNR